MHLGTAFQLIDDVLDYSGDFRKTGKNLGDDLAEGKPTLPLIYAMKHGTAEQAASMRQAIEHGGRDRIRRACSPRSRDTGALRYTREAAQAKPGRQCSNRCACRFKFQDHFATIGGFRG